MGTPLASTSYAGNTQVFAFNEIGMHCMDNDFSVFGILPPFNVLHAQVIKKATRPGTKPIFLYPRNVEVFYSAIADATGSINTTSQGKSNFWTYVPKLFGAALPPDVGLLGAQMPGPFNIPQPFTAFNPKMKWFTAAGIPITDTDDTGKLNSYPLMRVEALTVNLAETPLSSLSTVVPVSTEMHCQDCHATGSDGAFPGFHGVGAFSANPDINLQTRENILTLHDAINNTALLANTPVLCSSCHYSFALDLNKTGPTGAQVGKTFMSRAMHKHHGTLQTDPVSGASSIPIPDQGVATCYSCHPGARTKCFRGSMSRVGLVCQDCHGPLTAVAGISPMKNGKIRQPWIDMPRCQSCHTGDALRHAGKDMILRIAYTPGDPAASPRLVANKRFAEPGLKLFKESTGHGGVACASCHNSPHAEWLTINTNDNLATRQIQGHMGQIAECRVCHNNTLPPTMGGPHGMHNVNSAKWGLAHPGFFAANADSCKTCHGLALEGTVLSKAAAVRNSTTIQGAPITIPKGVSVHCSICHGNPLAP